MNVLRGECWLGGRNIGMGLVSDGMSRRYSRDLAWGGMLRGFNAQQIREAVLQLGEDGQFAPRPAEVRAAILRNNPVPSAPAGGQMSIRAC